MSEIEVVKMAGSMLLGTGIGLGGKIIFEWLKERHNGAVQTPARAPNNSNGKASPLALSLQKDCKQTHRDLDSQIKTIDICLVQHKGTIETHEKRLDQGSKDFADIKKSISSLDKSYAVLASKVK